MTATYFIYSSVDLKWNWFSLLWIYNIEAPTSASFFQQSINYHHYHCPKGPLTSVLPRRSPPPTIKPPSSLISTHSATYLLARLVDRTSVESLTSVESSGKLAPFQIQTNITEMSGSGEITCFTFRHVPGKTFSFTKEKDCSDFLLKW